MLNYIHKNKVGLVVIGPSVLLWLSWVGPNTSSRGACSPKDGVFGNESSYRGRGSQRGKKRIPLCMYLVALQTDAGYLSGLSGCYVHWSMLALTISILG
ncbi:uncharacterized protein GGS25DRAFT_483935 [Hypoxylon fragiforme]|uniref:uncharacterized protein n=1 Tax=Hypoxylon fragiforme TaxID=63214 RepID=UPI0020C73AFC|nr:uncharacterized protein GGS25DRAFT_483935 [Hypoxylon fragiforme]KAI2611745.1 hypothetical protein GGS25DRAFT_483935 [Hypoxylon fragiforme]